MCIRDRVTNSIVRSVDAVYTDFGNTNFNIGYCNLAESWPGICLLYTSDAADERSSVDLGGRRIIKKKNNIQKRLPDNNQLLIDYRLHN